MARLLQEIAELRLSAATNLTLAAAAMDAARPDIASELIEAQQRDVAHLRVRAGELLGLAGPLGDKTRSAMLHDAAIEECSLLERARVPATKSLRRQPTTGVLVLPPRREQSLASSRWSASGALLAIAATIAVALIRPLAPPTPATPEQTSASVSLASLDARVDRSYGELRETAHPRTPTFDVEQSSWRLHVALAALLPTATYDVDAARRVLDVLRDERALLSAEAPGALGAFHVEAARILTQLRATAQPQVLAGLPQTIDVVGAVPAQVGDDVASPVQGDSWQANRPPIAPPAPAGGSTAGSGGDGPPASVPDPAPATDPGPPTKVQTPVVTGGGSGGGGDSSSSGGAGPGLPNPLPSSDAGILPPEPPANLPADLTQH